MFLSGEICLTSDRQITSEALVYKYLGPRVSINHGKRGVHVRASVACGIISKGPWRSSNTPGIQQALSNAYLKTQGLYSLRDGWVKLHYSE